VTPRLRAALLLPLLLLSPAAAQEGAPAPPSAAPPPDQPEPGAPPNLPYTTTVAPTGEDALDRSIQDASQLVRLQEQAPTSAIGLLGRAQGDIPRIEEALRSEGFYAGSITITLGDARLGEPGTAERLEAMRPNPDTPLPVTIAVDHGPRYTIRSATIRPASPEETEVVARLTPPENVKPGDPARAGPILDADTALVDQLRRAGHPLARVADRPVVVDHNRRSMDVTWVLSPGPSARFARPSVTGAERVDQELLDRVAGRLTGQAYSPARQETARRNLVALGVFDRVRARAAERLDAQGALPVEFDVAERPRQAVGFAAAYETNYGPTGQVYWEHRNLFGNAERLRLQAEVSRLGAGGGTEDINYRLGANLRRPALFDGNTTLVLDVAGVRERLEAYDRDAFTASALFEYKWSDTLLLSAGPVFEIGEIGRRGDFTPFTLFGFALGARYDTTDSLLDPARGIRLAATATPFYELEEGGQFTRIRVDGSTYWDVTGDRGTVLALRGALGSIIGGEQSTIPLDKRFYAGGGGSVRGFDYQSIGPRDPVTGLPRGGLSLMEASAEIRQRVSGAFGMVGFLDAGSVGLKETPSFSDFSLGAGIGLRYATAVGPLRADFAIPLKREGDRGSSYGLYLGLGQAF
jgi:translocation and assembly module TamA